MASAEYDIRKFIVDRCMDFDLGTNSTSFNLKRAAELLKFFKIEEAE